MKKQVIKVKCNKADLVKETPEERKERIRIGGMYTRIVKPKKGKGSYNRRKFKEGEEN